MTRLFRCSGGHYGLAGQRESSKFLTNPTDRAIVGACLSLPNPILEIFQRPPITVDSKSRFGPPGLIKNPLYVASDLDTTFYEWGYHLLGSKAVDKIEVKISFFEISFDLSGKTVTPIGHPNEKEILNPSTDYKDAHSWFNSLKPMPEIIQYTSVRHPRPVPPTVGVNYAFYERHALQRILRQVPYLMKPDKQKMTFEVYDLRSTQIFNLKPRL